MVELAGEGVRLLCADMTFWGKRGVFGVKMGKKVMILGGKRGKEVVLLFGMGTNRTSMTRFLVGDTPS